MKLMTPVEILTRAREYVARGWTQGAFARTKTGRWTCEDSRYATQWCAVGALSRARNDTLTPYASFEEAAHALTKALPDPNASLHGYNDYAARTAEEVLALFDRAIKEATSP